MGGGTGDATRTLPPGVRGVLPAIIFSPFGWVGGWVGWRLLGLYITAAALLIGLARLPPSRARVHNDEKSPGRPCSGVGWTERDRIGVSGLEKSQGWIDHRVPKSESFDGVSCGLLPRLNIWRALVRGVPWTVSHRHDRGTPRCLFPTGERAWADGAIDPSRRRRLSPFGLGTWLDCWRCAFGLSRGVDGFIRCDADRGIDRSIRRFGCFPPSTPSFTPLTAGCDWGTAVRIVLKRCDRSLNPPAFHHSIPSSPHPTTDSKAHQPWRSRRGTWTTRTRTSGRSTASTPTSPSPWRSWPRQEEEEEVGWIRFDWPVVGWGSRVCVSCGVCCCCCCSGLTPRAPPNHTTQLQIGVLYWTYDADNYQADPKFAVRAFLSSPSPTTADLY